MDLGILVDASKWVSPSSFNKAKTFIKDVINCFKYGRGKTRFEDLEQDLFLLPGHPAELSDSVKLLLTDAKSHVFEIDPVLKSIH